MLAKIQSAAEVGALQKSLVLRNVSKPKIDRLAQTDPESNHGAEQFDRFQMMLGDQQDQLFQFLNWILGNFPAHQSADIELGNRRRQTFARGRSNLLGERATGFFNRARGHVIAEPANRRLEEFLDL